MDIHNIIQQLAIAIIPLLFAITVHEAAHGWVASKLGDTTALMMGRVTLNPAKHIDPIGTVLLPIVMLLLSNFIFGYAKPVPVNWQHLKNPRRDMALVALAGPGANLIMALGWAALARLTYTSVDLSGTTGMHALLFLHLVAVFGIHINILLMILNLIPIPPLDGSRVVSSLLPPRAAIAYERIEPYGIWILLGLLVLGALTVILLPPANFVIHSIKNIFGIPT